MKNLIAQINFGELQNQVKQDVGAPLNLSNLAGGISPVLGTIIAAAIPWVFTIAGMLLLVYLIFGGLQWMLSRGDPKAVQAAQSHVTNALVGFIIIFIAYWVVQLFGLILGLQGIGNVFSGGSPFGR